MWTARPSEPPAGYKRVPFPHLERVYSPEQQARLGVDEDGQRQGMDMGAEGDDITAPAQEITLTLRFVEWNPFPAVINPLTADQTIVIPKSSSFALVQMRIHNVFSHTELRDGWNPRVDQIFDWVEQEDKVEEMSQTSLVYQDTTTFQACVMDNDTLLVIHPVRPLPPDLDTVSSPKSCVSQVGCEKK